MEERSIAVSDRLLGLIKRMPAFREASEDDLRELFKGDGLFRFREYHVGETIIREGELDSWVFYLVAGKVRVLSQEAEVAVLSRYGEVFGEMGPIRGKPRMATVVAVDDVSCFAVDLSLLDRLPEELHQRGSRLFEEVFSEVVHERLGRANLDAAALRRDLAMAGSALAGLTDRVRDLEHRVGDLIQENARLKQAIRTLDPNFSFGKA